jgi:heme exporter protein CcmD
MIELGQHAVFIVWAYVGVTLCVTGLVGWTLYDAKATDKKLAELEAQRAAR